MCDDILTNHVENEDASDDYNIINYGIGGQIEVHVDYWNKENKRAGLILNEENFLMVSFVRRSQNIHIPWLSLQCG